MRVLLSRLSALGDIVHTWPLAELIRRHRPDVELHWLVERPFLPLVATHPAVTSALGVATRRWRKGPLSAATRAEIRQVVDEIRTLGIDRALDPQGLVKSAVWARLAAIPRRFGLAVTHRRERVAGVLYTDTVSPSPETRHVIDLNLAMAHALDIEPRFGAAPDGRFLLPDKTPPTQPDRVVLLPATGGRGKTWPASCFAELARVLAARGRRVVIAWGPGERELARTIAEGAGPDVVVAPPTDLTELALLLASAGVVIGGDTGTVHLAASLGVPTVGIFLSTDPTRNGPRGERVAVVSTARSGSRRGRARTGSLRNPDLEEVVSAVDQVTP